jgi:hypothetical protein
VKKPQWITAAVVAVIVVCLYSTTTNQIFGNNAKIVKESSIPEATAITIDSILFHAKENLSSTQASRLNFLEKSITRGDVLNQRFTYITS